MIACRGARVVKRFIRGKLGGPNRHRIAPEVGEPCFRGQEGTVDDRKHSSWAEAGQPGRSAQLRYAPYGELA